MPGKTFTKAPKAIMDRIGQIAKEHHQEDMHIGRPNEAASIDVTVEAFLVYGPRNKDGEQTGPALTVGGCQAAACIRATRLEERVAGRSDVVIHIDGDRYKEWSPETLNAILDHELEHIKLMRSEKDDTPILDDIGRPKLRMRPHDHDFGWFNNIAKRHGNWAIEVMQASQFVNTELNQLYFPGMNPKRKRA